MPHIPSLSMGQGDILVWNNIRWRVKVWEDLSFKSLDDFIIAIKEFSKIVDPKNDIVPLPVPKGMAPVRSPN